MFWVATLVRDLLSTWMARVHYIRGGGDPFLISEDLAQLASAVALGRNGCAARERRILSCTRGDVHDGHGQLVRIARALTVRTHGGNSTFPGVSRARTTCSRASSAV